MVHPSFKKDFIVVGVISALLVLLLGSFIARPQVAYASSCMFNEVASVTFPVTGGGWPDVFTDGSTITIEKITDGCGNEYGRIDFVNTQLHGFQNFDLFVAGQSGGATATETNFLPSPLDTPTFSGNVPICGSVEFSLWGGGGGGAGGCTPS